MRQKRDDNRKRCPVCGQSFLFFFADRGADWGRCQGCGLITLLHRFRTGPESLYSRKYYYSDSPGEYGYENYPGEESRLCRSFRAKADILRPRLRRQTGRILDVGCAAGFFLKVMKEKGWWVNGIEMNPEMARVAGMIAGKGSVHIGPAERRIWPVGTFDLITLWDTIEHVSDPEELLHNCAVWLRPGGLICLQTQDPESALARLTGPRWHHYKPAEHLWHFPVRSMRRILAEAGFQDARLTRRAAGRWVSWKFIRTKLLRYLPVLAACLPAPDWLVNRDFYINPGDEYILTAVKG